MWFVTLLQENNPLGGEEPVPTLTFSQLSRKVWNFQGRIALLIFEGTFIGFSDHRLATLNFQKRGEMYAF